jgi:hypothetical protein
LTLARALDPTGGRRETLVLAAEIARWLAVSVREQLVALRDRGLDALLLVDEPGLAHAGLSGRDGNVWDPLRLASATAWGLHVCGAVPWPVVDAAEPDVLSYDLTRDHLPVAARPVITRLLARGGRVAWGAVDPAAPASVATAAALLVAAIAGVGRRTGDVAAASLVTPACGTGLLSPARERLVAATLDAVVHVAAGAISAHDGAGVACTKSS